jgi:hypothetical protein
MHVFKRTISNAMEDTNRTLFALTINHINKKVINSCGVTFVHLHVVLLCLFLREKKTTSHKHHFSRTLTATKV